jgi:hypothetical protein
MSVSAALESGSPDPLDGCLAQQIDVQAARDLIASMVAITPVHSAAIANRVLQTIPSVVS